MSHRWLGVALGLAPLACEPPPSECAAWSVLEGDQCRARAWQPLGDPLGHPGAREVQLALGPGGEALLAWTYATATESTVVLAEADEDRAWTLTELPAKPERALEPAIAVGHDGRALLAWKLERGEGEVHLATRDGDGAWRWPTAPISGNGAAYEPRLGISPEGEALAIWNQWTGRNFGVAVARRDATDPDGPFVGPRSDADLLSPAVNYSNAPRLALGDDAEALVTWYQAPVDDLMVFVSERSESGDAFGRPDPDAFVSPVGGPVDSHPEANPRPALHPSGAAAVVWTQQIDETRTPVFLATRDADGTWHRPRALDDSLSDPRSLARCPQPAFAPDGSLVVAWAQTLDGETSVLAWRRPPAGEAEVGVPERLSSPGTEAVHATVGTTPTGGIVVVWAERHLDAWQVVARRFRPEDARWLDPEAVSEPVLGLAPTPALAVGHDGRVLVAWAEGSVVEGSVRVAELR